MKLKPTELDALLVRYFDGTLDADATARLTAELETNAEARALLRGIAEQAFAVAEAGRCAEARTTTRLVALPEPKSAAKRARWFIPWPVWAAAALVLLGVGLLWPLRSPVLMEVTQVNGAVAWTGVNGQTRAVLAPGMKLPAGTLELETGTALVQMRFADGTTMSLHGRAEAVFSDEDGKRVRLLQGTLSADVKPQPKAHPMRVSTAHAQATVLGTEFTLRADEATTKLDVFEGKVLFTCRFNARKVTVTGGFSSISDRGGPTTVLPLQPLNKP